jgi:hypothetical protein
MFFDKEKREQLKQQRLEIASTVELADLHEIVQKASANYVGDFHILQASLGALMLGRFYGWRFLRLVLSRSTYRRYEKVLDIKFNEVCPERGPLIEKSFGMRIVDEMGKFWLAVKGMVKVENKQKLME